ncbi:hypothetical protein GETHPA_20000 [Geothrix rubra]|uniref:Uncharacterized protein n=1 Tax=Geothrix rubra TaxID=2927977 RepID=A0ABQ5Q712_9BACT|nr:hypothetical protein [Geothrix rubra]GLH70467.1 hypothetical protein GETHPA_20000 [Geothrix rubra]
MLTPLLALLLSTLPATSPGIQEPDGSHTVGVVPPFHGEPAPPGWLRKASHAAADPDCRHYVYEAYAGKDRWLVRYVMLPEGDEAFREIEQVFLYPRVTSGPVPKGRAIPPAELTVDPAGARWQGELFRLVDRRDLQRD